MRIGITLQSLRHLGGIGTYTREIVHHLLRLDRKNEYVLIYPPFGQAHKSFGQYRAFKNATEVMTRSLVPHAIYWDNFVVPGVAKKYGVHVLFNPFLSVPVLGRFKKVLIMHNSEWFTMPEVFWLLARLTGSLRIKAAMKAADRIISVSNAVTEDCMSATGLPRLKFRTIYHGVGNQFERITDERKLTDARERYRLPDKFVLFVGGIYPQKNLAGLLRAFALLVREAPHQLVVAGGPRWKSGEDLKLIGQLGLESRVRMLGWVRPEDTPALYNLADCFVYPSLYEGFGLCLIEAMACGCPVVAASTGALPEVADGTALLVDPKRPRDLKDAILRTLLDAGLRRDLIEKGLNRAREFTWEKCARQTLSVLQELED